MTIIKVTLWLPTQQQFLVKKSSTQVVKHLLFDSQTSNEPKQLDENSFKKFMLLV